MDKTENSIALIRRAEKLALALNPIDGFFVGFSGGKDSQVLLDLVKRSGVTFKAYYSVTTIDPPENVYFIRDNYPEVQFLYPKENFFKLLEKKGLPTMRARWCCEALKESHGAGNVILTGVRADESTKRAKYNDIKIISRRKEHSDRNKKHTIDEIEQNEHRCIKGKDAIMIYPLLHWKESEIWDYIMKRNLPVNPCYETAGRVGCMFCPFSKKGQIDYFLEKYPLYKKQLLKHFEVYLQNHPRTKTQLTSEQFFEWWKTKKSLKQFLGDLQQTTLDL